MVENKELIDPYGIENVNFSNITETDARWDKFKAQRLQRGFDDSELWALDVSIAKFIAPRLAAFIDYQSTTPLRLGDDEWRKILLKILLAFEIVAYRPEHLTTKEDKKAVKKGLKLFAKWYNDLWD